MAWKIQCNQCSQSTVAWEIVDLIENHRNENGLFECENCGPYGYVKKEYELQNTDIDPWKPFLRGALLPRSKDYDYGPHYQPFVFLVAYEADGPITDAWFCYYKDLRDEGGRLKMGHGPGGPPVFGFDDVEDLIEQFRCMGTSKSKPDKVRKKKK